MFSNSVSKRVTDNTRNRWTNIHLLLNIMTVNHFTGSSPRLTSWYLFKKKRKWDQNNNIQCIYVIMDQRHWLQFIKKSSVIFQKKIKNNNNRSITVTVLLLDCKYKMNLFYLNKYLLKSIFLFLNLDFHKIIRYQDIYWTIILFSEKSYFFPLSLNHWHLQRLSIMNARKVEHAILQASRFLSR